MVEDQEVISTAIFPNWMNRTLNLSLKLGFEFKDIYMCASSFV